MVGMDLAPAGMMAHYRELMREQFKPPRCPVIKVRAGELGRKTVRGFYEYNRYSSSLSDEFSPKLIICPVSGMVHLTS